MPIRKGAMKSKTIIQLDTDEKCLKFEMPKMPKIAKTEKRGFIAFDSELPTGAQQRAPTNSEQFWMRMNTDQRG